MRPAVLLPLLAAAAAADPFLRVPPHRLLPSGACNLTGTWLDTDNDEATLTQRGLALNATSLSSSTGWTTARGALAPDSSSLWLSFGAGNNLTASITAACSVLKFSNGQTWTLSQPLAEITTVHAVFMTHLDIGFTLLAKDVCEEYFFQWFPKGIALSRALRAAGSTASYAVTTHPWLIQEFYDGKADCARTARNASMLALMDQGIADGDIRWHGKPMNNLVELEDAAWFATSLQMSSALNARFNKSWGALACKSTDVPGFSKSAIPIFAAAGKQSLHMGYNGNCRVPDLPQAFNWVHEDSGTSLLAFINNNYGSTILVPGSSHALAFFYSMDNTGPPSSPAAVESWWAATQARFPSATVMLSSLDAFTAAILPMAELLPQVTGEIGQSWSYGAPADPAKVAAFRAARRLRNEAVAGGWLDAADPDLLAYERRLWVGGPEHNWGLCFGCYLRGARGPGGNWSNAQFHALRARADYALVESGNVEKRNFTLPLGLRGGESAGYARYVEELARVGEALLVGGGGPDLAGYARVAEAGGQLGPCGRFASLRFNASSGALGSLVDGLTGHEWVTPGSSGLGALFYRTYTEADFDVWNREYNPNCGPPCQDFAKFGMDTASPLSAVWQPQLTALYQGTGAALQCSFIAVLTLAPQAVQLYGGAQAYYMNFTLDPSPSAPTPTLLLELTWVNKTATRLAEATFVALAPALEPSPNPAGFSMDVLGSRVSPLEVVDMGTQHLHAVWDGVGYDNRAAGGAYAWLRPLDTPLVAPGDMEHLLWYDGLQRPNMTGGWWFNVHNNLWGTAFPQWYSDNGRARWEVELSSPRAQQQQAA